MNSLYQEYRPSSWSEVIGHNQVKRSIQSMKKRGLGGRAFCFSGPSGVGKTTCGYLLAGEVCEPDNFIELDATDVTPARLDELEKSLRYKCLGSKSGRAVIINEIHGLRKDSIRKLLVILERIPSHVVWIFTMTDTGRDELAKNIDSQPLLSRCISFELEPDITFFAAYAKMLAEREGLGGADLLSYEQHLQENRGNMRKILCDVESGQFIAA